MNKLQEIRACLKTKEQFDAVSARVVGVVSEIEDSQKLERLAHQFLGITKGAGDDWRFEAGPASSKLEAMALLMRPDAGLKNASSLLLTASKHFSNTALMAQKHKPFDKAGLVSDVALKNSDNFLVTAEELVRAGRIEPGDFRAQRYTAKRSEKVRSLSHKRYAVESGKMVNFGMKVLPDDKVNELRKHIAGVVTILTTQKTSKSEKLFAGIANVTERIAIETINSGVNPRHVNSLLNFSLSACQRHALVKQERSKSLGYQR